MTELDAAREIPGRNHCYARTHYELTQPMMLDEKFVREEFPAGDHDGKSKAGDGQ